MILLHIFRSVVILLTLAIPMGHAKRVLADAEILSRSRASAPLTVDEVLDDLVRKNQEREQALPHWVGMRVYHLVYHGFPGNREAQMIVEATYNTPSTKNFRIVSQSGSKLRLQRVLKRLLKSEEEAAQPALRAQTQLNRTNYEFALLCYEPSETGRYVLWVTPKSISKYVYRGKVWVDGTDFAVTRIEGEPALNPSVWTKKIEICFEYKKMRDFWLPARNESVSCVRLGGRATLTIEYSDYRLAEAEQPPTASTYLSSTESSR